MDYSNHVLKASAVPVAWLPTISSYQPKSYDWVNVFCVRTDPAVSPCIHMDTLRIPVHKQDALPCFADNTRTTAP